MTREEFLFLQSTDAQRIVEQCLADGLSSASVAFSVRSPVLANQVKYLIKAARKMPSFYAARCIIDRQGFEQSSSQMAATSKFGEFEGRLAIDLTAGLGVDSYALSSRFDRVISVEMNDLRADVLRYNIAALGVNNLSVECCEAREFLLTNKNLHADLIYIDPSRIVDQGSRRERVFSLEDSSPNVLEIMPLMLGLADKIIIKLSPLFDIDECFRRFGDNCAVEVVSLGGECKEVLVHINNQGRRKITNTILHSNSREQYSFDLPSNIGRQKEHCLVGFDPQYLYVPDVVFVKSRTLNTYLSVCYPVARCNTEGYVLCDTRLENFAGQEFKIEAHELYQPKKIKKILKERGVTRATILHCLFPYSNDKILHDLLIKEGGSEKLFFSIFQQKPTIFFVTSTENQRNE
ncbi:MAG: hypothetical protein RR499_04175 [Mucinivorans sp.]